MNYDEWKESVDKDNKKEEIIAVIILAAVFIGSLILYCTGLIDFKIFCISTGIVASPLLVILGFGICYGIYIGIYIGICIAKDNIKEWRFNRKYNWLMKHKEELPIPDDYKEMLIERNRRFIGIDTGYYRSLRWYWLKKKLFHKGKQK